MIRRSGMSLTEVLVALFVVALGAIAILTLFPLGALQMGQALKDDRTAQAAMQADAYMRSYWKVNVVEPLQATPQGTPDAFTSAFTNPNNNGSPQEGNILTVTGGQSYPVFIDPMGIVAPRPNPTWVANPTSNLARRNLSVLSSSSQAYRTCSLMDGLGFGQNGAANTTGTIVEREMRYNWLWVLQLSDVTVANTATMTPSMTVLVFDKRASLFAPSNAELLFSPSTQNYGCTIGQTVVSFPFGFAPPVQKGSWLMDASVVYQDTKGSLYVPPNSPPNAPTPPALPSVVLRNANFYRVASITDNPNGLTTDIELQTPLVQDTTLTVPANMRQFLFLAGLSEVFQRPALSSIP